MNTTIKLSIASALAFGAVAAHASIAAPSSGSSDAILFAEVLNAAGTVVASYAGDTGVSISSLISGVSTTVLGSDANLAKLFAADTGTDTIEWAVQGGQYTGSNTTTNFGTSGSAKFITTSTLNSTGKLAADTTANLTHWAGLNTDISTINTNSGGASSVEGPAASGAGVWDDNTPSGTSGWYSNGPVTANVLGSSQTLFYVTGNGTGNLTKVAYSALATTAQLTSGGLVLSSSPVPLPPALWLLGSGLLGFAGVARRKLAV